MKYEHIGWCHNEKENTDKNIAISIANYENKEKVMITAKKYYKKQMAENEQYRILRRLRNRLWYALKNNTKQFC